MPSSEILLKKVVLPLESELFRCGYTGWDVYDGLNSRLFNALPFSEHRWARLLWIQAFKRSPVNFRRMARVPTGINSKGLALILRGYLNLFRKDPSQTIWKDRAYTVADLLMEQKSKDRPYACWGYNFPWEARAFSVPAEKPNMIASSFAAQAFLDMYDTDQNTRWLETAHETAEFIRQELLLEETEETLCFGYIPGEPARVHNANLMGASLLARLYTHTSDSELKRDVIRSVEYTVRAQNSDGSWPYGERGHHGWIDNFHTGFNLVAIKDCADCLGEDQWVCALQKGLAYHLENHFLEDDTPKYYNNRLYPVDIHNYAQGMLTFLRFSLVEKAGRLAGRAVEDMWNERKSSFDYQRIRWSRNRINYLRWSQAWMFYALTVYLNSGEVIDEYEDFG